MENEYLTVSQINSYLNKQFKDDQKLKNVYIKGEISNYSSASSGHSYFTLKDKNSQIPAVMFKGRKKILKFKPENGMKVIVKGNIEIYEKEGKYQLQANNITEDGLGDLHVAYEQLKKKLDKEGLFDKAHKKPIPKYPKRIGVITARTGAAIRDIITTIQRRYPICEILVFSTLVQGDQASLQIIKQLKYSQKFKLDTLIIGRGGGSIEDLWPFNDENLAREIYNCKIPIISAVGHEIDHTIADYIADLRAPTPTAAAELAVPQISEIQNRITLLKKQANKHIIKQIEKNRNQLNHITEKHVMKNPESIYEIKQMHLDQIIKNLTHSSNNIILQNKNKLTLLENSNILKNPKIIYKNNEQKIQNIINRLNYSSKSIISLNKNKLEIIKNNPTLKNPNKIYSTHQDNLNNQLKKLDYTSKNIIQQNKNKLEIIKNSNILKNPNKIKNRKENKIINIIEKLEILDPFLTLKRGYSITKHDDKVITSVKDIKSDDELTIELKDGIINTKVI